MSLNFLTASGDIFLLCSMVIKISPLFLNGRYCKDQLMPIPHFTYKEPETKRLIYVLKSFREFVQNLPAGLFDKVEFPEGTREARPFLTAPAHQCPISLRIHLAIISIPSLPGTVWPTEPPKDPSNQFSS